MPSIEKQLLTDTGLGTLTDEEKLILIHAIERGGTDARKVASIIGENKLSLVDKTSKLLDSHTKAAVGRRASKIIVFQQDDRIAGQQKESLEQLLKQYKDKIGDDDLRQSLLKLSR